MVSVSPLPILAWLLLLMMAATNDTSVLMVAAASLGVPHVDETMNDHNHPIQDDKKQHIEGHIQRSGPRRRLGTTSSHPIPRRRFECAAQPACVALGLTTGSCCPTSDGIVLDCCRSRQALLSNTTNTITKTNATNAPLVVPNAKCSTHSKCKALNLKGDCCPSAQGVTLECCGV